MWHNLMSAGGSSSKDMRSVSVGGIFGIKRHAAHIADHLGAAAQARAFQKQNCKSVTEVSSRAELEAIPFYEQGDASLSSPEAFKERRKIRRDVAVVAQLSRWWDAAIATARLSQPGATTISFDVYRCIYQRISMRLLEDMYDETEAEVEAREEWDKDSLGRNSSTLALVEKQYSSVHPSHFRFIT